MPRGTSAIDAARLQRKLWTPASHLAPVRLWLDTAAPQTITATSGIVSEWRDRSGRDRHASQASSGLRPAWSGAGGVVFTGAIGHFLETPALWTSSLSEIGIVALCTTDTVRESALFTHNPDPIDTVRILAHLPWPDGNFYFDVISPATGRVSGAWGGTLGARHLWSFVYSVGRGTQYVSRDGTTLNSTARSTSLGAGGTFTISSGAGLGHDGSIFEFLFVDDCSEWHIRRLEGYLAWKWDRLEALPLSHPYRARPPLIGT